MAKLPALVTALAATDGRDRATLGVIARSIREAGHITTTKRGGGAAEMTATDAAALVIGANAVQSPRQAATAVQEYRTFKQTPHGRSETAPIYSRLAQSDTLLDALAVLVEEAVALDAAFRNWVARAYSPAHAEADTVGIFRPILAVTFHGASVDIAVQARTGPNWEDVDRHEWRFVVDVNLMMQRFYTLPGTGPDRRVSTTIGLPTFLSLHRALFPAGHT